MVERPAEPIPLSRRLKGLDEFVQPDLVGRIAGGTAAAACLVGDACRCLRCWCNDRLTTVLRQADPGSSPG
jgi:hypothetical protein